MNNDFGNFLKKRAELICTAIYSLTGVTSEIEKRIKDNPDELWNEFELEIRKKINQSLTAKYGDNYWQTSVVPEHIKVHVEEK